jgi:hypothetical protein
MNRFATIADKIAAKYQDIGHRPGDKLWWVGADGKVKTLVSTGTEFHHDISPLDMDARWRGRLEKGGMCTMLPPLNLYSKYKDVEDMPLPDSVMTKLEKLGAKHFYLDTQRGMNRISKTIVR